MKLYYETKNTDTLAHWGIKGQKWGVRRFQNADGTLTEAGKKRYDDYGTDHDKYAGMSKRERKINSRIADIEGTRGANAKLKEGWDEKTRLKYAGNEKKWDRMKKELDVNKARYDISEVTNKWLIAAQKGKLDKTYRDSDEYKQAKQAAGKQTVDQIVYGYEGKVRIEALKNRGYSEKGAKGRVFAEQVLTGIAAGVAVTALAALSRR